MKHQAYTKYRAGGFFSGRPLGMHVPIREEMPTAAGLSSQSPNSNSVKTLSTARLIKWIATTVMFGALIVLLYIGGTIGYGYLQAWSGQDSLRALFSVTGNGSVDPAYLSQEAAAMDARLEHLDPVGEIYIQGIDSRWMIVEGADKEALKQGPGHIEETSLPGAGGNFAVAGDRVLYGAPFLHLDEIGVGDTIKVKMPYATFTYRVSETFIVTPEDTSVLEPVGYEAITLLTCDPPWDIKQRIVVRGELEQVQPAGTEI
jgi:LPXTG-site transpeptidase (sortase) family protein